MRHRCSIMDSQQLVRGSGFLRFSGIYRDVNLFTVRLSMYMISGSVPFRMKLSKSRAEIVTSPGEKCEKLSLHFPERRGSFAEERSLNGEDTCTGRFRIPFSGVQKRRISIIWSWRSVMKAESSRISSGECWFPPF